MKQTWHTMHSQPVPGISVMIAILFIVSSNTQGQPLKPDFTPGDLYAALTLNPALRENSGGEPFAWHATNHGDLFVKAFRVWRDTAWLNRGIAYYEFLRSHMHAGPDGYIGLIGPPIHDYGLWNNEVISDALVANLMLEFSELVMNDAMLKKTYAKKAQEYVAFCQEHMIEKWDKRNLWYPVGEYGDYLFGSDFVKPDDFSRWIINDTVRRDPGLSIQYNIANCLGVTHLRLYRITGETIYRYKAEKLFFRLKSNIQFFNNHYVWNYWSPFYEKDIDFEHRKPNHWVNVHPYRPGYQAIEVSQIVEAYHTGVVFDSTDIQRILNTNLDVMWNKNMEHPEFISSTGRHPDPTDKNGETAVPYRGMLWNALGDFSQTILDLYRRELEGNPDPKSIGEKIQQAYFDGILAKRQPGFRRNYAEGRPVIVKDVPMGNSPNMNYVGVIPYRIKHGYPALVVAKSDTSGNLTIDLYSRNGKTKIKTIHEGFLAGDGDGLRGFHMIKWDGRDPEKKMTFKGDYLVRWTLNGKYRDYAIQID